MCAQYPTCMRQETDQPGHTFNPKCRDHPVPSYSLGRPAAASAPSRTHSALIHRFATHAPLRACPRSQVIDRGHLVLVEEHFIGTVRVGLAVRRTETDAQVGFARLAPCASGRRCGDEVSKARERRRGPV